MWLYDVILLLNSSNYLKNVSAKFDYKCFLPLSKDKLNHVYKLLEIDASSIFKSFKSLH